MDMNTLDILSNFGELAQDLREHIERANQLKDQIEDMAMVYEDIGRMLASDSQELILQRQYIDELL